MSKLLSARALSADLGIGVAVVLRLYREGVIDADIHEGRTIRFNKEKCRKKLEERAKKDRREVSTPFNGMVTTH